MTDWILPGSGSAASDSAFPNGHGWRQGLTGGFGSPEENPEFWSAISPNSYLDQISGPVQLHHSATDTHVPAQFSDILYGQLLDAGQEVELYSYENDDHNISRNFDLAAERSIAFLDLYLN